ncbi:MAG: hypothetical protein WAK16_03480 [Candidatus Cybelea sp.]
MKRIATAMLAAAIVATTSACATPAPPPSVVSATSRDGHKDFNFLFGSWRTHYVILRHRLVHDNVWYDCYGTSVIHPFWNGYGNLEDGDLHCPPPRGYIHGMTLRTYDAASHQWSLYWGTTKLGLTLPQQVGHFDNNGVGQFFARDTYAGKPVVVRFQWSLRAGDHPRFEQAFSPDDGKTWETNWTTDYTRATQKGI